MSKRLFINAIRIYRYCLSSLLPPCCRFTPTCSAYCETAIHEHGLMKGLYLGLFRLLRCQPLCSGGYDPVPSSEEK